MDLKRRIFEALSRHIAISIFLPVFICLTSSCVWCAPLIRVRLQLKWYHQFQFAGYYAADAKGFYRDEGLDVQIIEGSKGGSPYKAVLERKAEFGIQDGGDLIYHRLNGEPLIAVAAIFQHSPLALIAKKSSGIYSPTDLVGRTVMIGQDRGAASILAMFRHEGIKVKSFFDQEPVRFTPLSWNMEDLVEGRIDALHGYITSEAVILKQRYGIETIAISPINYGIDFYGDTLFTSREILKEKPDLVARFRRASIKGWQYAMANNGEVVDMILDLPTARIPMPDRKTLLGEAEAMNNIVLSTVVEIGHMNPGRWERMAQIYQGLGIVKSVNNLDGFVYDKDFEKQKLKRELLLLGIALGVVGFLVAVSLLWVKRLRYQVDLRTKVLQESEERYRSLVEDQIELVSRIKPDGTFLFANTGYCSYFGINKEALAGTKCRPVAHPDDLPMIDEQLTRLRPENPIVTIENRVYDANGQIRWVQFSNRAFFDENGAIQEIQSVGRDITEHKRVEDAVRASERKFRLISENTTDFIFAYDMDLRLIYANPAIEKLTGYSYSELQERNFINWLHPEDAPRMMRMLEEVLDGKGFSGEEFRIVSKDGQVKWSLSSWNPMLDEDGRQIGVQGSERDITERKRAEVAQAEARELFASAFHSSPHAMSITRMADGTIFEVNNLWETAFGYSRAESVGASPISLGMWCDPAKRQIAIRHIQKTQSLRDFETDVRCKTGEVRQVVLTSEAIEIRGEQCLLNVIQDITERKKAESAIQRYIERLRILREIDRAVLAAQSPMVAAKTAISHLRRMVPCIRSSVVTFQREANGDRVNGAWVLVTDSDDESRIPRGRSVALDLFGNLEEFAEGRFHVVQDLANPPNLLPEQQILRAEGVAAYFCVPILSWRGLIGSLNLGFEKPDSFTSHHMEIAGEIAVSLGVALQNAQLIEEIKKNQQELARYSSRLVNAQEEERKRIVMELHDEVGQELTAISINLAAIEKALAPEQAAGLKEIIQEAASLTEQVSGQIHELSLSLRPAMLDDLGLVPSLNWLLKKNSLRTGIATDFQSFDHTERLLPCVEVPLYRIAQEALNNVVKHAEATRVSVRIERDDEKVCLSIEDDGKGFSLEETGISETSEGGAGLVGIRERVNALGGELRIRTAPGRGTRIAIRIPLK